MKFSSKSVYLTIAAIALGGSALSTGVDGAPPEPSKVDQATRARVNKSYGELPLSFEANKGQQDGELKFLARGSGYNMFLTNREAVLVLTKSEKPELSPVRKAAHAKLSQEPKRQSTVLRTQLIAANPAGKVTGEEELPGKVNYFVGNNPAKWHTDIVTYAKVRYEEVYPGIDLVYYGNQGQLEYDFVVGPGADPARIRLRVADARKMFVNEQGQLVVQTAGGAVRWNQPSVYQQAGDKRNEIKGKYVLRRGHELGFEVAAYDTAKPLVIDPILVYSTYLGGSSSDDGRGIAVDTFGNAYVTGNTISTNFPTTPGAFQTTINGSSGNSDAFVTKLNLTGRALVYSTYLGGSSSDNGNRITVDTSGNAYVTGDTYSSDFPTTPGALQTAYGGDTDAFVTELNPTGTALVYSTYLGGSESDYGNGIAVDTSGNAYIAGETNSNDFPTTPGAFQKTKTGPPFTTDAYVTKLNPAGRGLVYSTYLGGSDYEFCFGIAVDTSSNAYITGYTQSSDLPTTAGAFQTIFGGLVDAYVTGLNPTGSGLVYSTYLGGSDYELGYEIAVNSSGTAYVTGYTSSSDFPTTPGALQTAYGGDTDAYVTELNPTGTGLLYSTYLGGSGLDLGWGIAVDISGNAYVTGETLSSDFPTTPAAFQTTYGGSSDAYVTELNPTGTALVYSTYLGGRSSDKGYDITVDSSGNAYVTGNTASWNFPITLGAFQRRFHGDGYDTFVSKIDTSATSQIVLGASRHRMGEAVLVRLFWTGANSPTVNIYRDGVRLATVENTGRYNDSLTEHKLYTYKVCEVEGAMNCSNEVTVRGP